jgi:hypothetical protein
MLEDKIISLFENSKFGTCEYFLRNIFFMRKVYYLTTKKAMLQFECKQNKTKKEFKKNLFRI